MASASSKTTYSSPYAFSKGKCKQKKPPPKAKPAPKAWELPALSIPRAPPTEHQLEILKKRHYSANEDMNMIKETLKKLQSKKVTVEEFVAMISPYTSDNGSVMIEIMADELAYFRKMVKKVFDTMTQDMSDVLTNEQIQMHEFYDERIKLSTEKMHRAVHDIFRYAPHFDQEEFYANETEYLLKMFPMKGFEGLDEEMLAILNRQQAYHRFQWLRSEETRLHKENDKLQERLREVKKLQRMEHSKAQAREAAAEEKQLQLETEQADAAEELEKMHVTLEKTLVDNEIKHRLKDSEENRQKSKARKAPKKKVRKRPEWNSDVCTDMEFSKIESTLHTDISSASIRSKSAEKKEQILSGQIPPSSVDQHLRHIEDEASIPPYFSPARFGSLNEDTMDLYRMPTRRSPSPRPLEVQESTSQISLSTFDDGNLDFYMPPIRHSPPMPLPEISPIGSGSRSRCPPQSFGVTSSTTSLQISPSQISITYEEFGPTRTSTPNYPAGYRSSGGSRTSTIPPRSPDVSAARRCVPRTESNARRMINQNIENRPRRPTAGPSDNWRGPGDRTAVHKYTRRRIPGEKCPGALGMGQEQAGMTQRSYIPRPRDKRECFPGY